MHTSCQSSMSFSSSWGLSLESVQLRGVTSCAAVRKAAKMYNAVTYNAVTYNAVTYNAVTHCRINGIKTII